MQAAVVIFRPRIELHVRRLQEVRRKVARAVARNHRRQFRQALVEPRVFVGVHVPMDHVLKLVRQYALVVRRANGPLHRVQVDEEHLVLVGPRDRFGRVFALAAIIRRDPATQVARVQDVQVRIAVDAGEPLGAKHLDHLRADRLLERVRRALYSRQIRVVAFLEEHVNVLGGVDQPCVDLELVVLVQVVCREGQHVPDLQFRCGRGRFGDVRHTQQALGQIHTVTRGDHGVFKLAQRLLVTVRVHERRGQRQRERNQQQEGQQAGNTVGHGHGDPHGASKSILACARLYA